MAQLIDPELATECIAEYQKIFTSNDAAAMQQAYTESITFSFVSLNGFMAAAASVADKLEIKLGVYTEKFVEQYPDAKLGRLTAFLYTRRPGYGDPPDDPLNMGDLKP